MLLKRLRQKRPLKMEAGFILHWENTSVHTMRIVMGEVIHPPLHSHGEENMYSWNICRKFLNRKFFRRLCFCVFWVINFVSNTTQGKGLKPPGAWVQAFVALVPALGAELHAPGVRDLLLEKQVSSSWGSYSFNCPQLLLPPPVLVLLTQPFGLLLSLSLDDKNEDRSC